MKRILIGLALIGSPAFAEKSIVIGLTCTSGSGEVRKFNVDLRKRRYEDAEGLKTLGAVSNNKVILEEQNPDLLGDNGGMGPMLHSLELNRITLVLTEFASITKQGKTRKIESQCVIGSPIDFKVGQKF